MTGTLMRTFHWNKKMAGIALVHFCLTFLGDASVFDKVSYRQIPLYWAIKAAVLILLFIFWQKVYNLYRRIRENDRDAVLFVRYFGIYFGILLTLLLITWPGNWKWDEWTILWHARRFILYYWQHWLTTVFYMISLSLFPFPAGIVLVQIFCISMIVGQVMLWLGRHVEERYVWYFYIPLCSLAVLSNNLYPIRLPLCAFLELLLFAMVLHLYHERKTVSYSQVFALAVLTALNATWRTEAVVYILLLPLLFFVGLRRHMPRRKQAAFLLVTVVLFSLVQFVQSQDTAQSRQNYFVSGIVTPLHDIVISDFSSNSPEEDLQVIDRVIDLDKLRESPSAALWSGGLKESTEEELSELKKVYVKLVLYNFPTFLKGRLRMMWQTNGMQKDMKTFVNTSSSIFDPDYDRAYLESYQEFLTDYPLNRPFNIPVRAAFLNLLEGRSAKDFNRTTILCPLLFNAIWPIIILLVIGAHSLWKRKWMIAGISIMILVKTALITLMAPMEYFMYYLPVYVCGYSMGVLAFISWRLRRRRRSTKRGRIF